MYNIEITLGEPIEDVLTLQQGDNPLLKITAYDYDGSAFDIGYTGTLYVGRSGVDPDEWVLTEIPALVPVDNVFYFNLEDVAYSRGDYQAYLFIENPTETTPEATPDSVSYSFKDFKIEVI